MLLQSGDALLVVDVQRDFLPGGSLGVQRGDRVLAPVNRCIDLFARLGLPVFASRDWHPSDHCSFRERGGPWPVHCVAGSPGAEFDPGLRLPTTVKIVSKATQAQREAYSAFSGTDLGKRLEAAGAKRLFVAGLATDYCVLQTALDALQRGLRVVVVRDAIAAVDAQAGDGERALARLAQSGVIFVESGLLRAPSAAPGA